jgi:hypothetical protein
MTRPGDVKHIQAVLNDHSIQVRINEILAWCCAPVADYQRFLPQSIAAPFQQRIVVEINLSDRDVVGRPPVGIGLMNGFGCQSTDFHGSRFPACRCALPYSGGGDGRRRNKYVKRFRSNSTASPDPITFLPR